MVLCARGSLLCPALLLSPCFFSPVVGWSLHVAPSQAEGRKAGPPLLQGLRLQPLINTQNWEVHLQSVIKARPKAWCILR